MIGSKPCIACPYRCDVPSGVWAASDYDKLPAYDLPTGKQPLAPFMCHAQPEALCFGWAVCHENRGHDRELLALRLLSMQQLIAIPDRSPIELFKSGAEAAEHGKQDIERPKLAARRMISRLLARYARLRKKMNR